MENTRTDSNVENIVIIGSGFSALTSFLKFKKYNPIIIAATHKPYPNLQIKNRFARKATH